MDLGWVLVAGNGWGCHWNVSLVMVGVATRMCR